MRLPYRHVTEITHWGYVRNAWYGPETWVEIREYPAFVKAARELRGKLPRRYIRLWPNYVDLTDSYANWYVWLPVFLAFWARELLFFVPFGLGYNMGLYHFCQPRYLRYQWRKLRLGPERHCVGPHNRGR